MGVIFAKSSMRTDNLIIIVQCVRLPFLKHDYENHNSLPLIYKIHSNHQTAYCSYKAKAGKTTYSAEADNLRPVSLLAMGEYIKP